MPLLLCQYEAVLEGLFESAVEAAHDALEPGRLEQPGQDDHVGEQAADALDAPLVVSAMLVLATVQWYSFITSSSSSSSFYPESSGASKRVHACTHAHA